MSKEFEKLLPKTMAIQAVEKHSQDSSEVEDAKNELRSLVTEEVRRACEEASKLEGKDE